MPNLCPGLLQVLFLGLQAVLQLGDLAQTGLVLVLLELQGAGERLQPDLRLGRRGLGLQQVRPQPRQLGFAGAQLRLPPQALSTQRAQSGAGTRLRGAKFNITTTTTHTLSFIRKILGLA